MPRRKKDILRGNKNTALSVDEERAFRHDLAEIARRTGQRLNPDSNSYDYRGAWKTGHRRLEDLGLGNDGQRHWPSEFRVGMKASRVPW